MIFDMLDDICAENLGTDTKYFIEKIENTTEWRRKVIIGYTLEAGSPEKLEQARRCFKLIK